ncbi:MAG TPA: hypothetical protein VGH35_08270 [Gaiellaceae bacterium]
MPGSRRLSQRISEGDGIAIIARVRDVESARAAEADGAKALAVDGAVAGIRESTSLPLLWVGGGSPIDADAVAMRPGDVPADHLEAVLHVRDEDELEEALEQHDPEIFLLAASGDDDDDDPLASVLELLPDVPAGKLAIADVDVASRHEVVALERAGFDAVLAPAARVGALVGSAPPDV